MMLKLYVDIPLKDLTLDAAFQHRADELRDEVIADYAEHIADLPPPVVFQEGDTYWFPGGHYRYAAHDLAGRESIRCEVREGTRLDAFIFSLGENAEHGMPLTNLDKRKTVRDALKYRKENNTAWSDRVVAKLCKVSHNLVHDMRREMEEVASDAAEDDGAEETGPVASIRKRAGEHVEGVKRTFFDLGIYDMYRREISKLQLALERLG